jgi:hypothetical protein
MIIRLTVVPSYLLRDLGSPKFGNKDPWRAALITHLTSGWEALDITRAPARPGHTAGACLPRAQPNDTPDVKKMVPDSEL